MENNELILDRQEKIELLTDILFKVADGENIIGDGENLVYEGPGLMITHDFADGVYIRRMDLGKDAMVVGAVHKHLHVWFLLTGHVTIATKLSVEDYEAPCYVIAPPGTQRLIQANEDSIFINIHKNPSDTRDINQIEKEFCAINMKEYDEYIKDKNK
jgi:quercetin dioxygenase-like cupin family protein|tara:strand:+ start:194 stop:667 length:474 start_codon:yes stop_codon:yes gene_type:complete